MSASKVPVLIVGGGPVGLAMGIDLHHRGVASILVDQLAREARTTHPRMDQVSLRTMEIIRRWGEVDEITSTGFPREFARDIVFMTSVLGYELEREPMEADATRLPPPFSPEKHELCPQNFFDPALQRIADRCDLMDVRYGTRVIELEPGEDEVRITLEDVETGAQSEARGEYLAACDGADSFVARALGIGAKDNTLLAQSTNIFLRSTELSDLTRQRQAYRYLLTDEEGLWGSIVNISGEGIWRVQLVHGDRKFDGSEESAHDIIAKAIGSPVEYELLSIVPWRRREMLRDRFAKGRCFLVGDSAHQLSPTGGYGMNTGIAEAADLSWKIAATLAGWGGEALLDSYDAERRPVARRAVKRASHNLSRMNSCPHEPELMKPGPAGDVLRKTLGTAIRSRMAEEWESFAVHLGYRYKDSPIVMAEDGDDWVDDLGQYRQTSAPGARAPHAWLADGRSTLDLFGEGFVLLAFRDDADVAPMVDAASAQSVPLRIEQIRDGEIAALYEKAMVLVRPDGHVAWRGDTLDADEAASIMAIVRGARPRQMPS